MPDPNAHADDMKSTAEYQPRPYTPPTIKDSLPPMWWFCPWSVVTALADTIDQLKSTSRGEQASRIQAQRLMYEAMQERNKAEKQLEETKAALSEANEARSAYDRLWNAVQAETPDSCFDGHGPAGWIKNVVKQLAEAHRLATEYRRQLDDAETARGYLREQLVDLQGKFDEEILDHAATLGHVRKLELAKPKPKPKPKAKPAKKKKGGSK